MSKIYTYQLLPKAITEIEIAYDYYNTINSLLGERFLSEINDTITTACKYPLSRSYYWNNFRAVLLPSFPYFLFYTLKKEELIFYALFPAKDNPDKLKQRLKIKS